MMKSLFCALLTATSLTMLAGCGLKGPLYYPPKTTPPKTAPVAASLSQPEQTAPATTHDTPAENTTP